MNKDNRNKNLNSFIMFFLGCVVGVVMMSFFVVEDIPFLITLGSLLGLSAALMLITFVLANFVIPHRNKKTAAVRALGKDGIRIMRRDDTAKLAYKGIYAIFSGKFPQAEEHLQQALAHSDVRQNQMFCIEWLIRLYEEMNNDAKLMWCYRKAAEYAPDNPEAQSRLGHAYFSDGKLDRALYCFEQALRYDPNHGYSYFSIAKIQMIRGEDGEAFETLQKLVKINENHPLCHAELADWYAMRGDAEKAEEECKKAQLCGIHDPDELTKRINAMLSFHKTDYDEKNLPDMFYRRIEPKSDGALENEGGTT